ncbi:protein obstructor-E [Helicoverpa armigera]|uniref:Chitin-binding type-2 domain-containing protein n=1 Tax=Helicoverpa armigera TaxID=29058 RepID=A0A2W1BF23_HELAM|nr:protein obstructor-E [Helicoverpa armigera]XP_047036834.1 protein obstructor-E-like [Helicoverpa zea]PZC71807.1 hypothetical protein B5X24_HaOG212417 [Helicoverpa armigera]
MFTYVCFALVFVAACNAQAATDAPVGATRSSICKQRNAYYKVDTSCDSYVECTEFVANEMLCPDGLHFNPEAKWPSYPCGYPMDVPCQGRGSAQPAQPTADCPHQYGYFPSPVATADNCGQYRMCVAGKAIEMVCPTGLAFNPDTGRCDWPDLVASCKTEDFLGFSCPAAPTDADGNPLDLVFNYKYQGNCFYFFSCEKGRARLLSCDNGLAFDPASGRCVDAEFVNCDVQPTARAS